MQFCWKNCEKTCENFANFFAEIREYVRVRFLNDFERLTVGGEVLQDVKLLDCSGEDHHYHKKTYSTIKKRIQP